jgi:hypothetical protein
LKKIKLLFCFPFFTSFMSGLGGSAQLRSAVGGSEHHLPVTSSSSLVNNLYAPAHHQPSSHHHNNQFLYGNGDLAALQSSQFRNDIFSPELNWQQQHQQHHQLTTQSYQPQHFNTSTTLPEHHTFPDPASSHLQPFSGQLSTNGWPSSLGDPTGFTQHESTISPAQISNNFTNARPLDDNERPASTLNTYPQVKQSGQFVDFAAPLQPSSGVATAFTMINGCPHVSLHYCDEFQDAFGLFSVPLIRCGDNY